jgi:predicted dehydrogenase
MSDTPLRIGVVGCGSIAQLVHLPLLQNLPGLFELSAVCDASRSVADGVAQRYGARAFTDHRALLETAPDAVLIATPAALHADVAIDALAAGCHVFCEKPAAILLGDVDRMLAARDAARRIVQVGTMKRFDPAVEAAIADARALDADDLLAISVVAHDPEHVPFVRPGRVLRGDALGAFELRERELAQVEEAVGTRDPDAVEAFTGAFLGSLVHHLNVVHGLLGAFGEPLPAAVISGDWWAGGTAAQGALRLSSGGRCDLSWVQTLGLHEHEERTLVLGRQQLQRLVFPSPWLLGAATVYERSSVEDGHREARVVTGHDEAYELQLRHFHAAATGAGAARNTLEEARLDISVLTAMFAATIPGC